MFGRRKNTDITLEALLSGSTCCPLTLREFRAYLKYEERSVENLNFYLWYQRYKTRFAALAKDVQDLSPPVESPLRSSMRLIRANSSCSQASVARNTTANTNTNDLEIEPAPYSASTGMAIPLRSRSLVSFNFSNSTTQESEPLPSSSSAQQDSREMNQPFRSDVTRVLAAFFHEDSQDQLNISSHLRAHIQAKCMTTTHPSLFEPIALSVYDTLTQSSLPHFVSIASENVNSNGKTAQLLFAILAFVSWVILEADFVMRGEKRGWRWLGVPLLALAVAFGIAVAAGTCMAYSLLGMKQLHMYEIWTEISEEIGERADSVWSADDDSRRVSGSITVVGTIDDRNLRERATKRWFRWWWTPRRIEDETLRKKVCIAWWVAAGWGLLVGTIGTGVVVALPM